jgi:hypothetical protein
VKYTRLRKTKATYFLSNIEDRSKRENLHFTLNGETRRAPGLPDACAQMAWEDADKVS